MQQQKMTLRRLAALLGVHSSTVGRVMDPETRHMVSEEVAQRILKEAARFGYRPNQIAAALRTRRSNIVGVGTQAAQLILRRLQKGEPGEMEIGLKPQLVVRGSSGAPALE
jgi:DNA-binding LacI/PurR family transcriptional regulator